jgi:hypothetical protein
VSGALAVLRGRMDCSWRRLPARPLFVHLLSHAVGLPASLLYPSCLSPGLFTAVVFTHLHSSYTELCSAQFTGSKAGSPRAFPRVQQRASRVSNSVQQLALTFVPQSQQLWDSNPGLPVHILLSLGSDKEPCCEIYRTETCSPQGGNGGLCHHCFPKYIRRGANLSTHRAMHAGCVLLGNA